MKSKSKALKLCIALLRKLLKNAAKRYKTKTMRARKLHRTPKYWVSGTHTENLEEVLWDFDGKR